MNGAGAPECAVFLPDPCVLIDLETTGANPASDRITEIALLRIEGGQVVRRWQSLVNPERGIPPFIQNIIGITDAMVADSPTFAALAEALRPLLAGAVFVAHNARFDYGFVRNAYAHIGESFDAPVLCTVKLSRALFPQHHRHGLDALIERHGLVCEARHRAMGDVDALWQFVRMAGARFDAPTLQRAVERAMKFAARPPGLPEGALEGLPDACGVYSLIDGEEQVLQVGHASSLRARLMEAFGGKVGKREARIAEKLRRIDWVETAGELDAMLRELALLRTHRPAHNRPPEPAGNVFGLRVMRGRKRAPVLQKVRIGETDPAQWDDIHGVFRHRSEADHLLRELAAAYALCLRRLGLETDGQGGCTAYRAKRCAGVCAGRERPEEHDARLIGALGSVGVKAWPWPGAIVIGEEASHAGLTAWHVFDRWCHLGSVDSEAALQALCANPPERRFDADIWRLLQRWLAVPVHREAVRSASTAGA